jgi:type I restriction enzyme S subunit
MSLPEGWIETTFDDIASYIQRGKSPQYTEKSKLAVINQKAIRWNGIRYEDLKYVHPEQWSKWPEERYAQLNDILWNSTGTGTIGRACLIEELAPGLDYVVDSHVTILRFPKGIDPKYVFYWIMSPAIQEKIDSMYTGTTNQVELGKKIIQETIVPLSPLNEQQRIVAKLEAILAKVQSAQAHLASIPELLKRTRQAILSAAVSGKLTEEWRENKNIKVASEIVNEIKTRRLASAKDDAKINEIYLSEEDGLEFDIPDEWGFVSLDKLCFSFQYGTSAKSQKSGKIPVIRMGNLQNGEIDWADLVYSSDDKEIEKYSLNKNDILFNRTNSPELVGKTSIYRGEQPAIFAGYLIRINYYPELDPEYLNYCLNTSFAKDFCWRVKSDGVSQSNINAHKLSKFEIPFCSIEEQQEIVRRVGAMFERLDHIEAVYKAAKENVDNITQSVLAKAFRGELVPQDPDDESARFC